MIYFKRAENKIKENVYVRYEIECYVGFTFCRDIERGTLDSAATLNRFCKFTQKYSEFDRDRRFIFLF